MAVIDFSMENLKPGTSQWVSAREKVRRAFEDCGFFVANFDKVGREIHSTLFPIVQEMFDLPIEIKIKNTGNKPYDGYMGQYNYLPLYESLSIRNPTAMEAIQSFTQLMWPSGNNQFRQSVLSVSKNIAELNETVIRMLFESYGVERFVENYVRSIDYQLRFFGYRVPQEDESDVGVKPHTDKSFMTILYQNQVDGLQAKTKDGEWVDVKLSPSSFLVLAGDALMAWSNDRIAPCNHQVVMRKNERRYSLGLFTAIDGIIQVPEELQDEEHPLKYKPFNHSDYLRRTQSEQTTQPKCFIKDYYGVSDL
ncbi:probable 2-oxoglutarate-dependent dioxygenase AOP1 [Tripterygium wilfordii]|uniref:probable 2-oxoglutarate-dependent dioxygenase AOP1 n=1 Tax=Tripterygium wilfordii TaxID=458696 RepID=UPI0018F8568C|nr:probable 2-oxoglutarate-dependent dioxygenase AOP1 [Tripterygium wilfordii]